MKKDKLIKKSPIKKSLSKIHKIVKKKEVIPLISLIPSIEEKSEQPPQQTIISPQQVNGNSCSCGGMFQIFGYSSSEGKEIGLFKCDNCGRVKR